MWQSHIFWKYNKMLKHDGNCQHIIVCYNFQLSRVQIYLLNMYEGMWYFFSSLFSSKAPFLKHHVLENLQCFVSRHCVRFRCGWATAGLYHTVIDMIYMPSCQLVKYCSLFKVKPGQFIVWRVLWNKPWINMGIQHQTGK